MPLSVGGDDARPVEEPGIILVGLRLFDLGRFDVSLDAKAYRHRERHMVTTSGDVVVVGGETKAVSLAGLQGLVVRVCQP